jgi:hypothetical protein
MWLVRKETPSYEVVKQVKCETEQDARRTMRKMAGESLTLQGEYLIYSNVVNGHMFTAIEVDGSVWTPAPRVPWTNQ